jgi:hypothetical protein
MTPEKGAPNLLDILPAPRGYFAFFPILFVPNQQDQGKPFTQKWSKFWSKRALDNANDGTKLFPGAKQKYEEFRQRGGVEFLKDVAERGADPNLILRVLIEYLWNEEIPDRDHNSRSSIFYKKLIEAIALVRQGYQQQNISEIFLSIYFGENSLPAPRMSEHFKEVVELWLWKLEWFAKSGINLPDPRKPKRRSAEDKTNRVIFFLHEYIKLKTGKDNWEIFWNLLVAAGAIKGGVGRPARGRSSWDGQIKQHIYSFKRDHPREVGFLESFLTKESTLSP